MGRLKKGLWGQALGVSEYCRKISQNKRDEIIKQSFKEKAVVDDCQ